MKPRGMKAVAVAMATVALTVGMAFAGAGAAYATDATVSSSTEWANPTGPVNNWKSIGGKNYKYITLYADMWAASGPDYVGISNSNILSSNQSMTLEQAKKGTLFGIWASAANEEPNPYQANYYWNLYANSIGNTNTSQIAATPNPPTWDSASGVWDAFKFRPDIVLRCNALGDAVSKNTPMVYSEALGYINQMKYYTSSDAFENKEASEGKTSEYYVAGDETYNPVRHEAHNESPFSFVDEFYWEAEFAEKLVADTANNAQVSDSELNWKTANQLPRTTRYNDLKPTQHALNVEKLIRGSIYYILEKINDGTVAKKKVAYLVNSPEATGTTVDIATFDFTESISTNGKSDTGKQGTATTTRYNCNGYASFSPLVVDQARGTAAQKIYRGGVHVPSTNSAEGETYYSDTPYTAYTVTADDILDCDIIYGLAGSMSADDLKTWMTNNVTGGDTAKQKANQITYLTSAPAIVKGANYTAEKLVWGVYAVNCFYPELFPNMELAASWFDNVYHLKSDSVASALNFAFANSSLPSSVSVGSLAGGYSASDIDVKIAEGFKYFELAKATDPVIMRILANQDLDGNTTGMIDGANAATAYDFSSFAPKYSYFKAWADTVDTPTPVITRPSAPAAAKKANPMTVKAKTVTASAKKKTTVKATAAFTVSKAKGKVTYKKTSGDAKITVAKAGKVTVKKGLKAGNTYKVKVKVSAAGNNKYKAGSKTVTLKVKVK